jgi:hypothetical protein
VKLRCIVKEVRMLILPKLARPGDHVNLTAKYYINIVEGIGLLGGISRLKRENDI